ncbi:DMT family transporter [Lactiplantibacillus argentoratensis]|nr:DMT family transporter [Lactiplantibacillus argentoratensis]MBP5808754.1 DMT family transporter [Lactiplantibacillus argentoratensis]
MLAILVGLAIGVGLPMQTSINSRLRSSVGSPFVASLTSFAVGTIFLAIITLIEVHTLGFPTTLFASQPVWIWLGGLFGVVYLTGNILLFPKLGSVQTVIMPVLGQILAGLLIDNFGWFDSPKSALTMARVVGAILVLVGVIITVAAQGWLEQRHNRIAETADGVTASDTGPSGLWIWRVLGVIAGMLSATQTAVNGHLGRVLGSTVHAAFISFLVGTIALIVIVLVLHPQLKLIRPTKTPNPWWMWIGGMIGALYVLGNVYLVPVVGTGLAVVIVLVGLMAGSLMIDQFGWFASKKDPISGVQLMGLLVMIVGVALIRVF